MGAQHRIVPWRCGRCNTPMGDPPMGLAICPRCKHAICRRCRVRVRTAEGVEAYCRECAREAGLAEEPERSWRLPWRRRRG